MSLYLPDRHEALKKHTWSEEKAKATIAEIATAAIESFQGEQLWAVHPNLQESYHVTHPITGLWIGAAGSIWALTELQKNNPQLPYYDFSPYVDLLIEKQAASLAEFDAKLEISLETPSYLFGSSAANLLRWKLTRDPKLLDALEEDIRSNITNPINEFMWAAPGTMLCAWFLYQQTQEQLWKDLFQQSADYLFSVWEWDQQHQCYVWVQHMYGENAVHLGVVHGFVGNILPLLKGITLLSKTQQQQLIERTEETLFAAAKVSGDLVNWMPCLGVARSGREDPMVQLCHGAPGVIMGVADMWSLASDDFKNLLTNAGNLIWQAGPLEKPWGLCHGTAGNGYAFLKLYQLTGQKIWLERARLFAMHAIDQYQAMREKYGCIRVDSWCGDLGLALYLQDCIVEQSQFPMLDYF